MKTQLLSFFLSLFSTGLVHSQVYMYGTTSAGGANGYGTIYRVDQNGQNFEKLFDFSQATGGKPFGGLTLANGKLYGFTTEGGQIVNSGAIIAAGTFYEFNPIDNSFNVIEYIDDKSVIGNTFNSAPTLGSNGLLYSLSELVEIGTPANVLSSFDPVNATFTAIDTIPSAQYGQGKSKLLYASDGNLYWTSTGGPGVGSGQIIKFDLTTNQPVSLHTSSWSLNTPGDYNGARNNPLFEALNGSLFGTSFLGGQSQGGGTMFRIDKDGTNFIQIYNP